MNIRRMTSQSKPSNWPDIGLTARAFTGMIVGVLSFWANPIALAAPVGDTWIGSWAASMMSVPQPRPNSAPPPPATLDNQTVRQVVRLSIGGRRVRVRLSNEFGAEAVALGAVHVALTGPDGAIQSGTDRTLTFGGQTSVVIPSFAPAVSDPADLKVPPLAVVAISIYYPTATATATVHSNALQTASIAPGDLTGAPVIAGGEQIETGIQLAAVEVEAPPGAKAFVALGDSITDGNGSTVNANRRWPDRLAERLAHRGGPAIAVLNEGISGNRVLHDLVGPNLLSRFDRDVLSQPKLAYIVVMEGINDFGIPVIMNRPEDVVTAQDVEAGYRQLIGRAHARGIKIYGATLTPFRGAAYFSEDGEAKRQAVNSWVRTANAFDAVIDFDAVLRDSAKLTELRQEFDSGDHLHPNDAGYKAMADAVDLGLLR